MLRFLGHIWAFPLAVFGLLLLPYYWPQKIAWRDGCLEIVSRRTLIGGKWVGAQTFGGLIVYRGFEEWCDASLRVHERVHVRQAMIGGVFFALAYGATFAFQWVRVGNWKRAYYLIPFEVSAYDTQARFQRGELPDAWGVKPPPLCKLP